MGRLRDLHRVDRRTSRVVITPDTVRHLLPGHHPEDSLVLNQEQEVGVVDMAHRKVLLDSTMHRLARLLGSMVLRRALLHLVDRRVSLMRTIMVDMRRLLGDQVANRLIMVDRGLADGNLEFESGEKTNVLKRNE